LRRSWSRWAFPADAGADLGGGGGSAHHGAEQGVVGGPLVQARVLAQEVFGLGARVQGVSGGEEPVGGEGVEVGRALWCVVFGQDLVAGDAPAHRVDQERRVEVLDSPEPAGGTEVERGQAQVERGASAQCVLAGEQFVHHGQSRSAQDDAAVECLASRAGLVAGLVVQRLEQAGQFGRVPQQVGELVQHDQRRRVPAAGRGLEQQAQDGRPVVAQAKRLGR